MVKDGDGKGNKYESKLFKAKEEFREWEEEDEDFTVGDWDDEVVKARVKRKFVTEKAMQAFTTALEEVCTTCQAFLSSCS